MAASAYGPGGRYTSPTSWRAITLEIPEDIAAALRFPPYRVSEELRRELAVFLVKEGLLPRYKARQLAAMELVGLFPDARIPVAVADSSIAAPPSWVIGGPSCSRASGSRASSHRPC